MLRIRLWPRLQRMTGLSASLPSGHAGARPPDRATLAVAAASRGFGHPGSSRRPRAVLRERANRMALCRPVPRLGADPAGPSQHGRHGRARDGARASRSGVVTAIMRMSNNGILQAVAMAYIWLFRGTPVILQLLLWYNLALVFPTLGIPGGVVCAHDRRHVALRRGAARALASTRVLTPRRCSGRGCSRSTRASTRPRARSG
jgi:hypothetical protein